MARVLLIFDDYQEIALTETYLKKVGFDVVGIMNEMSIQEQILVFNPDVLIANGKSNKVSSLSVGKKLKDQLRYDGKVLLIFPRGVRPDVAELMRIKMDAAMEAPVQPEKLLQVLAKFSGASAEVLIDKLRKARLGDPELNKSLTLVAAKPGANTETISVKSNEPLNGNFNDSARVKKYDQFLTDIQIDTKKTNFERNELKSRQAEMKKSWDFNALEEIDALKRKFASALFKKDK